MKTTHTSGAATGVVSEIKSSINDLRIQFQGSDRWEVAKPIFGQVDDLFSAYVETPTTEIRGKLTEQLTLLRNEGKQSNKWVEIQPLFNGLDGMLDNFYTAHPAS